MSAVSFNVFLYQENSPSKPSVAELAGRFKGHILPMPTSNDEVLHLYLRVSIQNYANPDEVLVYGLFVITDLFLCSCHFEDDLRVP